MTDNWMERVSYVMLMMLIYYVRTYIP